MKKTKQNISQNVTANREYRASLFHTAFGKNKANALSLYNAINESSYTNEDDLEFTTLEDVIYMKMKNDVSFLVGTSLSLYEHQSTYNPNMPLRGLLYFADLYKALIKDNERIYSKQIVRIPNPKYIVFYNGPDKDMPEDVRKQRLSDSFEEPDNSGDFEWTATMVNINPGYNKELFEKCKVLKDYSLFIQKVGEYNKDTKDLTEAVNRAVEYCIKNDILKELLEKQRREGLNMVLTEFDEKKYEEMIRAEEREEGREEGRAEGIILSLCEMVSDEVISLEYALKKARITEQAFKEATLSFGLKWNKE